MITVHAKENNLLSGNQDKLLKVDAMGFALVVILKAEILKLPVVLKRAVASRILVGQRPLQAPVD